MDLAQDTRLDRKVALKIRPDDLAPGKGRQGNWETGREGDGRASFSLHSGQEQSSCSEGAQCLWP
jgi:hypothetical protein